MTESNRDSLTCRDLSFAGLLAAHPLKFKAAPKLSVLAHNEHAIRDTIMYHERMGLPLVLSDLDKTPLWDFNLLNPEWLRANFSEEIIPVRNMINLKDNEMTFGDFLTWVSVGAPYSEPNEETRLYGKDAPCPAQWSRWLLTSGAVPPCVLPMGSGDLFPSMQPEERPETLMTYFGIGDTYTPCHKDPCASQGQNLMTYAASGASAFWFLTPSDGWYDVTRYFKQRLNTELDFEARFLQPQEFAQLPCTTYICKQLPGDLVLVPRRSCHQVFNSGGLTIKTSWSRMSVDSLKEGIQVECPMYRRLCRPEVYRTKLLCYRSLSFCCDRFQVHETLPDQTPQSVLYNFNLLKDLIVLFDEILVGEYEADHAQIERYTKQQIPTCDFCSADIFQSFFECSSCTEFESLSAETYQLCATCYVEGRSCLCRLMKPMQRWPFDTLVEERNRAARLINTQAITLNLPHVIVMDESLLQNADSCRVFRAAYHLWRCRTDNFEALKVPRRCSLNKGHELPHDTTLESLSFCGNCSRGYCFQHALLYRRTHAADDILEAQGVSKEAYHSRHKVCKASFDKTFGTGYGVGSSWGLKGFAPTPEWPVYPNLRLVWAALTFDDCHPTDERRSVRGWYDKPSLAPRAVASEPSSKHRVTSEEIDEVETDEGDEGEDDDFEKSKGGSLKKQKRKYSGRGSSSPKKKPAKETPRGKAANSPVLRSRGKDGASDNSNDFQAARDLYTKKVTRRESGISREEQRRVGLGLRTRIEPLGGLALRADSTRKSDLDSDGEGPMAAGPRVAPSPRSSSRSIVLSRQLSASGKRDGADKSMPPPSLPPILNPSDGSLRSGSTATVSTPSTTRDSIIQVYAAHYRALVAEQHRFSDAGRDNINETLEQLQSLLGIRPLDLAMAGGRLSRQPSGERVGSGMNGSSAGSLSNTGPSSSTSPYKLRRISNGRAASPSSDGIESEPPSPEEPSARIDPNKRYLFPSSSSS